MKAAWNIGRPLIAKASHWWKVWERIKSENHANSFILENFIPVDKQSSELHKLIANKKPYKFSKVWTGDKLKPDNIWIDASQK